MRVPWLNFCLLGAIGAVFVYQLSLGGAVGDVVARHGFTPSALTAVLEGDAEVALWGPLVAALTSLFMHGGWLHVLGNLLYLRVFGDNVEDRFGHVPYLLFYLLGGLAGVLGHYLAAPTSSTPLIGASGAIAAVLGAYIVLFPTARVVTLFPVFIFLTFIEVPAVVFLGIWAAQQLLYGFFELQTGLHGSVAWFAHLGGFTFGLLAGALYQLTLGRIRRERRRRRPSQLPRPAPEPPSHEPEEV